jgi:hypothetical protein
MNPCHLHPVHSRQKKSQTLQGHQWQLKADSLCPQIQITRLGASDKTTESSFSNNPLRTYCGSAPYVTDREPWHGAIFSSTVYLSSFKFCSIQESSLPSICTKLYKEPTNCLWDMTVGSGLFVVTTWFFSRAVKSLELLLAYLFVYTKDIDGSWFKRKSMMPQLTFGNDSLESSLKFYNTAILFCLI